MDIIDILHGEHRMLLKLFDWAEDLVSVKSDIGIIGETGKTLSRLMISHARMEEDIFFDSLEPLLGNIGPLAVVVHRNQHRELLDKFKDALAKPVIDTVILGEAIGLCRKHFISEESILFPMAKRLFDPGELDRLAARLDASESLSDGGKV